MLTLWLIPVRRETAYDTLARPLHGIYGDKVCHVPHRIALPLALVYHLSIMSPLDASIDECASTD